MSLYKRKKGIGRKVETYNARLVVNGYNKKLGFGYEKTFLPLTMLKYIKILLSIATHLDYEI